MIADGVPRATRKTMVVENVNALLPDRNALEVYVGYSLQASRIGILKVRQMWDHDCTSQMSCIKAISAAHRQLH
jgi:hypothetical protein